MPVTSAGLSGTYLSTEFPCANTSAPWHPVNTQLTNWILPHSQPVEYEFNAYGYRGTWTIDQLADAVWCFGDSQTAGLGVDNSNTWVAQLETLTSIATINFGIAGASNDTITRTLLSALQHGPEPRAICVLLTDADRREIHCDTAHMTMFPQIQDVLPGADQHLFRQYINSVDATSNQVNRDKNWLLIQAHTQHIPTVVADWVEPMWVTAHRDPALDGYHIGPKLHRSIAEYFGKQLS